MEYFLNQGHSFSVPTTVAEHLLGIASHDQLKVLLYLLCYSDRHLTTEQIAQNCKVLPSSVEEAIVFWQNVNILNNVQPAVKTTISPQEPSPAPAAVIGTPAVTVPGVTAAPAEPPVQPKPAETSDAKLQASSSNFSIMPSEIADRIQNNRNLAELFHFVEKAAGKPLTMTEQKSFIWMTEYLGLGADLLMMLAAFCIQSNCFQVRYMEKIAMEWQERGIVTHTQAEGDISRRASARSFTGEIVKMMEMDRRPTEKMQQAIDEWQQAGLSLELIRHAYEKSLNNKNGKFSFYYLNGILQRWISSGIRTIEAAEKDDAAFRASYEQEQAAVAGGTAARDSASSIDMSDVAKLINRF
ncbi:MAG: DnaD domain protein [Oscillospiraceae bacterium]|nr:DnaD domain protein [Oscillospiraceae bacterium]